jgi:uncharacterized protein
VLVLGILLALNLPGKIISGVQLLAGTQTSFADFQELGKVYDAVITGGSWMDVFAFNLKNLSTKFEFQVVSGRLFITLGFFLLGMYTGRQRWFERGIEAKPLIRKICKRSALIMCTGLVVGLGMFAADAMMKLGWQQNPVVGFVFMLIYDVFNAAMVVFFISGLTLLMMRNRWQAVLYKLVPVGKMALTSYITQTIFGLLLFYGAGLGLYGKTSPGLNYLIGILFFFFQVGFSTYWLRYFNYGPLEWLWRSGTYLKWQPMIRKRNVIKEIDREPLAVPETAAHLSA